MRSIFFFALSIFYLTDLFASNQVDTASSPSLLHSALKSSVTVHVLVLIEEEIGSGSSLNELFLNLEEDTGFFPGLKTIWSQGSGFVYRSVSDGYYVVTNAHVVEDYHKIWIEMNEGELYSANLIGTDVDRDVAVLKFNSEKKYPTLAIKPSVQVNVGDTVYTIGSPYRYAFSVAKGIVSGKNRDATPLDNTGIFFQTDAAINLGNSGGPLISTDGKLVGLNTFLFTNPNQQSIGLGFSLISDLVQDSVEKILLYKGDIKNFQSWLGIVFYDGNLLNRVYGESNTNRGAYIQNIYLGSPAHDYGFKPGDILLSVNESPIQNVGVAISLLRNFNPDEEYAATVLRHGAQLNLTFKPIEKPPRVELLSLSKNIYPGITSDPLPKGLNRLYGYDEEIQLIEVTKVFENSIADKFKLLNGDLIYKIDDKEIPSMKAYTSYLTNNLETLQENQQALENLKITVIRDGLALDLNLF